MKFRDMLVIFVFFRVLMTVGCSDNTSSGSGKKDKVESGNFEPENFESDTFEVGTFELGTFSCWRDF